MKRKGDKKQKKTYLQMSARLCTHSPIMRLSIYRCGENKHWNWFTFAWQCKCLYDI